MPHQCLVFHLRGPMASWGDVAIGTRRPSDDHPSLSAIVGLLCAAEGITREDNASVQAIEQGYDFVTIAADGAFRMTDYHTVQSIRNTELKKKTPVDNNGKPATGPELCRADELNGVKPETVLSKREYVCNGRYSVFVIPHEDAPFPLEQLSEVLERPIFTPYLGRKSCPLDIRMAPEVVQYDRLWNAVCEYGLKPFRQNENLPCRVFSTYSLGKELSDTEQTIRRQDVAVDRKKWLFTDRQEFQYYVRSLNDVHQQNAAN